MVIEVVYRVSFLFVASRFISVGLNAKFITTKDKRTQRTHEHGYELCVLVRGLHHCVFFSQPTFQGHKGYLRQGIGYELI
jgi:hypothetical protein